MYMVILERSIPCGKLAIFLLFLLAIVRNAKVPYFIRFNALQALLIDIGVILISYAFRIILQPIGEEVILSTLSSTVLIAMLSTLIFAVIECCQGKEPDLPGISQAVRMQLY